ncbi:DNA (cytosine-5-)-methyltransferase [Mammaliicoccus sciuri]
MSYINDNFKILKGVKYIDLFAGIGGFHAAMDKFGATCVFASEWDKFAKETYFRNYNIEPHGDITKIDAADIPDHDILCAGFPCQPFSVSGKRMGFEDTRGTLFFDVARITKMKQPKLLFLENVKNFLTHDNGKTLATVKSTLEELGYDFYYKVLNASQYGLPQNRERIYMIAIRKDLKYKEFEFPEPTNEVVNLKMFLEEDQNTEQFIINRPDIKLDEDKLSQLSLMSKYPQKPIRVGTINKGGQGERIYSEYGHAVTLSAQGGGPGSKTGCYFINNKVRKLSPRECARIQGFDDTFEIIVSNAQSWKQFGNSVPIKVLENIILEFSSLFKSEIFL